MAVSVTIGEPTLNGAGEWVIPYTTEGCTRVSITTNPVTALDHAPGQNGGTITMTVPTGTTVTLTVTCNGTTESDSRVIG